MKIVVVFLYLALLAGAATLATTFFQKLAVLESEIAETRKISAAALEERSFPVTLTAYTPSASETDSTPYQTATMTRTMPGRTAACSRDLIPHLLGRDVYIPGHGVWKVEDVMNKRFENSLDLCVPSKKDAMAFGKKQNCAIIVR